MRTAKIFGFLLPAVLLLGGCPNAKSFEMNDPFTVSIGERRVSQTHDFSIILNKIDDDSRCPSGANCVWAGEVIVNAIIETNRKAVEQKLTYGGATTDDDEISYDGFNIQILSVSPKAGEASGQADYKLELTVGVDSQP